MKWNLSFISEEDFTNHVRATIDKYGEKLESFDIVRFNKNIIDPIKMIFDKTVYQSTWEEIVSNEIFRQRDKSNNNDIGYFHQRIFSYIQNCHVPDNGKEGGWDGRGCRALCPGSCGLAERARCLGSGRDPGSPGGSIPEGCGHPAGGAFADTLKGAAYGLFAKTVWESGGAC